MNEELNENLPRICEEVLYNEPTVEVVEDTSEIVEEKEEKPDFSEEKSDIIKEYFYDKGYGYLKEMSKLFQKSEGELTREFGEYKAKILYGKMDYMIVEPDLTVDEFISKCALAVKYGFKSVTVLPTFTSLCKSTLLGSGVKTRTLIAYPYGEEQYKVKLCAVKNAVKSGADELVVSVSLSSAKNGETKIISKELKKIVKIAGKCNITAMIGVEKLSPLETEAVVKQIAVESGVYSVMPTKLISSESLSTQTVKDVLSAVEGKCFVDGGSDLNSAEETVSLYLAGVNSVSSGNCPKIAEELNGKIASIS